MQNNPLLQIGQQYLVIPLPASSMNSKEDPRNSKPVAAEKTCSSSVQQMTSGVPSCPVQHCMIMQPGFMFGATSTNLPTGISNQEASGSLRHSSPAGVAPAVFNETMAVLGVRQRLLNELEVMILQDAMLESYQD